MIRQIKQAGWLSTATDRDLAWPLADGRVVATVDDEDEELEEDEDGEEDEELDEDDGLDGDDEYEIDDLDEDEDEDYFDSQSIRHGSTCELSKVDE